MANHNDVNAHHDVSKAVGADTNPSHVHPHELVPVRVSKESGFAAPGLDVPAEQSRPKRAPGTPRDHVLNKPLRTENQSLIGEHLGEHPHAPVQPTETYVSPGQPMDKFEKGADIAAANANFEDCSELLMRPRGGASHG
jgi:hypothetical protein